MVTHMSSVMMIMIISVVLGDGYFVCLFASDPRRRLKGNDILYRRYWLVCIQKTLQRWPCYKIKPMLDDMLGSTTTLIYIANNTNYGSAGGLSQSSGREIGPIGGVYCMWAGCICIGCIGCIGCICIGCIIRIGTVGCWNGCTIGIRDGCE